jgi:hypothetical protein
MTNKVDQLDFKIHLRQPVSSSWLRLGSSFTGQTTTTTSRLLSLHRPTVDGSERWMRAVPHRGHELHGCLLSMSSPLLIPPLLLFGTVTTSRCYQSPRLLLLLSLLQHHQHH